MQVITCTLQRWPFGECRPPGLTTAVLLASVRKSSGRSDCLQNAAVVSRCFLLRWRMLEAELTDHKTYPFPSDFRGEVTPDLPVHHRILRITITKERVITAAEAITVPGPYAVCPKANEVFDELVGLKIAPGWRRQVQAAIGGRHGCTHITELLGPVATIAYQTMYGQDARERRIESNFTDADKQSERSHLANTCVGYADDRD